MNYDIGGGTLNDKAIQRMGVTPVPDGVLPPGSVARQQYTDQGGGVHYSLEPLELIL